MKKELGEKLRVLRKSKDLSMEDVCKFFIQKKIHISKQTISNYEKGRQFPVSRKLIVFIEIYETNLNFLFNGELCSLDFYNDFVIKYRKSRIEKEKKRKTIGEYIFDLTHQPCEHKLSKSMFKIRENDTDYTVRACKICQKAYSVAIEDS